MKTIFSLTAATIFIAIFNNAVAAEIPRDVERYESFVLPNTEVRYINSEYTNEAYRIYVSIPAEYYKNPNKSYSSIFLLDADYSFPIVKNITDHLSDRKHMPNVFVFGIAYAGEPQYQLHRTKDYTPTFVATGSYGAKYQKLSGGAPKFAQFIKYELIPYLNKSFRLDKQKTLVGHSYGGLFASWLMLQAPSLFTNYIIVSPSLWYDQRYVIGLENEYAKTHTTLSAQVFFAIGDKENGGDFKMLSDLNEYTSVLKKHAYKGLNFKYTVLFNNDHDIIFPEAFTRGLMYIYQKSNP